MCVCVCVCVSPLFFSIPSPLYLHFLFTAEKSFALQSIESIYLLSLSDECIFSYYPKKKHEIDTYRAAKEWGLYFNSF